MIATNNKTHQIVAKCVKELAKCSNMLRKILKWQKASEILKNKKAS